MSPHAWIPAPGAGAPPAPAGASRGGLRRAVSYECALAVQDELVRRRQRGDIEDVLWLLEHPPTITWGSAGGEEHLLVPRRELEARGFALCPTSRGGDITCHEPGQLVGYPIVLLRGQEERDLHRYLRLLEEAIIRLLGDLGLEAERIEDRTGVWVPGRPPRKIASLGVRCSRWVTSHGLALNVENGLEGFQAIVPCGIAGAAVTSLERELAGSALPDWKDLCSGLHRALEAALERPLRLFVGPELLVQGPA